MTPWNDGNVKWSPPPRDWLAWPRMILRALACFIWTIPVFILFLLVRYGQRIFGKSHHEYAIFRLWGHGALFCAGLRLRIQGQPMEKGGVLVANHVSLLDIPVLYAAAGGNMIAKAEIRRWPLIGFMGMLQGTEFVIRERRESKRQVNSLAKRIKAGDRMILFAEGTTSDGLRVLPFKSTLFAAMVDAHAGGFIQPVTMFYHAPKAASANFYGCWGDMNPLHSAMAILQVKGQRNVDILFHEPIAIGDDRKALRDKAQSAVEAGFKSLQEAP